MCQSCRSLNGENAEDRPVGREADAEDAVPAGLVALLSLHADRRIEERTPIGCSVVAAERGAAAVDGCCLWCC